jgi:hypothetical protein
MARIIFRKPPLKKKGDDTYSNVRGGWFDNHEGKRYYMKSQWELNWACYQEFRRKRGLIKDWLYEPDEYWFDQIKRGTRSYRPDFKIIGFKDEFYYDEVKGYMDKTSLTKLNRMKKYYPHIVVNIIDHARIKAVGRNKSIIPGWQ